MGTYLFSVNEKDAGQEKQNLFFLHFWPFEKIKTATFAILDRIIKEVKQNISDWL